MTIRRFDIARLIGILAVALPVMASSRTTGLPIQRIVFEKNDTERCLKCHGMANFAFRDTTTRAILDYSVAPEPFRTSVHGKIDCQQCHTDIREYPHVFPSGRAKVGCDADCHAADKNGKVVTHAPIVNDFRESAHRKGLTDPSSGSPNCLSCHGNSNAHRITKAKQAIGPVEKMAFCTSCHADTAKMIAHKVNPEAFSSYKRSFHYKAIRFGVTTTAVCQDCHTTHHIMPKDSARSSIAVGNIAATCGQEKCHPGAKMNFAMSGANHLDLRIEREPVLRIEEEFFNVLTLGTMLMLVVGIVLDIQKKFGWLTLVLDLSLWLKKKAVRAFGKRGTVTRLAKKLLVD